MSKLIRFKIEKSLSSSTAFDVIRARAHRHPNSWQSWKYNPVTGWASVKLK